jgi:hypothetical protein
VAEGVFQRAGWDGTPREVAQWWTLRKGQRRAICRMFTHLLGHELRADGGALAGATRLVRGAQAVAAQAATFSRLGLSNQLVLVNGHLGFVSRRPDGRLFSVLGFTIASGKIVEIDILADPARLNRLDLSAIES